MKKIKKILIIIVIAVVAFVFMKNFLIKTAITTVGSSVVGAPIKIRKFSMGFLSQKVHIKEMAVYNPKGFPKEPLVRIPEIRVDYDVGALFQGKLHVPLIIFDLREVILIKNQEGDLNVDALKIAQTQEAEDQKEEGKKPKKKSKSMPMQIDELRLNVERVVLKDYTQGDKPVIVAYEVALKDKVFKDIKSPEQMAALIMVQAMGPTAIKSAGIYAAATVLGAAFLPAGVVGVLAGKDSSTKEFNVKFYKLYDTALELIKEIGQIKTEERHKGLIKAKVYDNDIVIQIVKVTDEKTQIVVSARKLMLPKPEIAGGIVYQVLEKIR